MPFTLPQIVRGSTARTFLRISWDYPVHAPEEEAAESGRTVARAKRTALSREQALAAIAETTLANVASVFDDGAVQNQVG